MRRTLPPKLVLTLIVLILISCRSVGPVSDLQLTDAPVSDLPTLVYADPTPEAAGLLSIPSDAWSTPIPIVTPSPTSDLDALEELPVVNSKSCRPSKRRTAFEARFLPAGSLYVGDRVSIEVVPPEGFPVKGLTAMVYLGGSSGTLLGQGSFSPFGLGGRRQATLLWVWDTSDLPAGEHTLTFVLQPDGLVWNEQVWLSPRGQAPSAESQARWAMQSSDCCRVHYLTHTAAERDLPAIMTMLAEQSALASQKVGVALSDPVEVTLLPRIVGHGGFASGGITISYLDRDYAGGENAIIFHHELVHILDARLGGGLRPPFLVEGYAVYLSGGHFKPEPLLKRAAALLPPEPGCGLPGSQPCGLGLYIPLSELMDQFYQSQHEIGYLQAGAFTQYLVETYGWQAFSAFYRDIPEKAKRGGDGASFSQTIGAGLEQHFGLGLDQMEQRFVQALEAQPLEQGWVEDVRLSVLFYDRVRCYQLLYDPSAYFLYAWLPDGDKMRERDIVADYLRGPSKPENLALEALLVSAEAGLRLGDYIQGARLLDAIGVVLDGAGGFGSDPLAADYYALVLDALSLGYQPQRVQIEGNSARVWAISSGLSLIELSYQQSKDDWIPLTALSMNPWQFHALPGVGNEPRFE